MLTDLLAELDFDTAVPPAVGVSACLLGEAVRYDGTDKFHPNVAQLTAWLQPRRYCPEVGIGLPVPRPAIEIVRTDGNERVRGVDEPEKDFTDELRQYAGRVDADLDGYIFKARSPSCGWRTTPVFDQSGQEVDTSSGLFNQGVRECFPDLPFCDEEMLDTPDGRAAFVLRVYCHRMLRRHPEKAAELLDRGELLAPRFRAAIRDQLQGS